MLEYIMEKQRNLFSQYHLNKTIITIFILHYIELFIIFMERFKYYQLHCYLTAWNKVFKLHKSLISLVKKNTFYTESVKII